MRVGLYVDGALLFGSSESVRKLILEIKSRFDIKDMGPLTPTTPFKFLGMEIERKVGQPHGIVMKQERYAKLVLSRFGMEDCKPGATPMAVGTKLDHEGDELPEENRYQAIVGSLLYLAVKTRPDIAYAVGVLSRFMSCPRQLHMQAAKRLLRYVSRHPGAGIFFRGRSFSENRPPMFSCRLYSDADYAADPVMRKSTSGMLLTVNGAPVTWKSKLQSVVALSTCELEFVAAAAAVREGLWFRKLFLAVSGKHEAMQLFCDSESALSLMQSTATKISGRTKHIGVQFWFVLNHIMKGDVVPKFVRSEEMLADGFTKINK